MAIAARSGVLAFILAATGALSSPARAPVYVLDGYRFDGLDPKITTRLAAGLKHHPGARITEADIRADTAVLAKELRALHLRGRLFTGFEEGGGHLWVHFDFAPLAPPQGANRWMYRHLDSQHFEAPPGIAASAMAAATHLKPGDTVTTDNVDVARKALLALYAKSRPGKDAPILQLRVERRPDNKVMLTWILRDRR